ncbi:hypothetical protein F4778DRAFT_781094 [Xylariomycetidae sp. FL2044]|nr:hypothetical protein F4778DRAFT_781094 [Xylariomycetidae sp. FL2044]
MASRTLFLLRHRLITRQSSSTSSSPVLILGTGLGLSLGTCLALRQSTRSPLRMDSSGGGPSSSRSFSASSSALGRESRDGGSRKEGGMDPEVLKQISGGSVSGFLSGLLVSVFSKTLVLILGFSIVVVQVAARYGIDIVDQLRLKQRVRNSRVLDALQKNPGFKVSFGLFFAMAAFMQF